MNNYLHLYMQEDSSDEIENFDEIIKGAALVARRKAFRHSLPYAILRDGEVILVFRDKHTEISSPERIEEIVNSRSNLKKR